MSGRRFCALEESGARRPQAAEYRHLRLFAHLEDYRPRVPAKDGREHTLPADAILRGAGARGRGFRDDALGQIPALEYRGGGPDAMADVSAEGGAAGGGPTGGADRWGPNLAKLALLGENPTLARAVAAASQVANRAGDGSQELNRDEIKQLEAPLKMANGKPLRAQPTMDLWALGMIAYELFVNEPFFAGCSDDVALQGLGSITAA